MAGNGQRWKALILGIAVSAVSIWLIARQVNGRALLAALIEANTSILLLCLVVQALGFICLAMRSRVLFSRFREWNALMFLRAHLIGFGGNVVLPFRIGELLRAREIARDSGLPFSACLGAVAVERGLDIFWVIVFAVALPLVATVPMPTSAAIWIAAFLVSAALGVSFWVGSHPEALSRLTDFVGRRASPLVQAWLGNTTDGLVQGLGVIGSATRFTRGSAWTLGYWLANSVTVAIWLWAFRLHLPWYAAPTILVFIALGAALPAAPGYLGTYDLFAVNGLALFGIAPSEAAAVAISGHFISTIPATLLALGLFFQKIRTGTKLDGAVPS